MNNRKTAIQFKDVSYAYKSDWTLRKFKSLTSLSLEVFEGEAFGFLGHNGAGKTTAIKCLLGLLKPAAGSISIFSADSRDLESRLATGYVPEQPYFYDHLTVSEIMEMYAALAGVSKGERSERINNSLAAVGISSKSKSPMRSLSKGLTQRVAMAQAIVNKPSLLVLDEPFSGLDPLGRKEFADLLLDLRSQGTTIFMSSHILADVEFLCNRVSILSNGTLKGVFDLTNISEAVHGHYELLLRDAAGHDSRFHDLCSSFTAQGKFLRLRFDKQEMAEQALARAIEAQLAVESYQFVHGGLEELFVRLVGQEASQTTAN